LIVCNGEPIVENQLKLTDLILRDQKLSDKIIIYLHQKSDDKIMLTFNNEMNYDYISIENLKNFSQKRDASKTFNYVVNLFKFLANLCAGNNYQAIETLQDLYKFDTCVKVVTNSVLCSELRTSFADLLHKLWFESGMKAKLAKSRFFCKIWDKLEAVQNTSAELQTALPPIPGSEAFPSDLQKFPSKTINELWLYIDIYLKDTLRLWKASMFNLSDLQFLRTILQLTIDLIGEDKLKEKDMSELTRVITEMLFIDPNFSSNPKDQQELDNEEFSKCRILLIDIYQSSARFEFNTFILSIFAEIKKEISPPEQTESLQKGSISQRGMDADNRHQPALLSLFLPKQPPDRQSVDVLYEAMLEQVSTQLEKFKSKIENKEDAMRQLLLQKIKDFVKVTKKERELMSFLMKKSVSSDMELKIKTLNLALEIFYKEDELQVFLSKMVLIKSSQEIELYESYSLIALQLDNKRDKMRMGLRRMDLERRERLRAMTKDRGTNSSEAKVNTTLEFLDILDKILEYPQYQLQSKCPYPFILKEIMRYTSEQDRLDESHDFSDDFKLIIQSNFRLEYARTTPIFHYINESLNISDNILFISGLGDSKPLPAVDENLQKLRDPIFQRVLQYLEILLIDNCNLKSSCYQLLLEAIKNDALFDGSNLISFLLMVRQHVTDNERLLEDPDNVRQVCSFLLDCLISQKQKYSPTTILIMDILPKLTRIREKILKENQNIVLSLLFSSRYCSAVRDVNGSKLEKFLQQFEHKSSYYQIDIKSVKVTIPEIRFVHFYLVALNACIVGCNSYTENFCQMLFSPRILHQVLKLRDIGHEVKEAVADFILETYLKTDIAQSADTIYIIEDLMKVVQSDPGPGARVPRRHKDAAEPGRRERSHQRAPDHQRAGLSRSRSRRREVRPQTHRVPRVHLGAGHPRVLLRLPRREVPVEHQAHPRHPQHLPQQDHFQLEGSDVRSAGQDLEPQDQ